MKKYKYTKSFQHNGKQYKVYADTEEELIRKLATKKLMLEQDDIKESEILFSDYAWRWLEVFKEPYVSKDTVTMYRSQIKTINKVLGHRKLKNIVSTDIQSLVAALYEQGYSKSKIDKTILTVKQIYKRALIDRKVKYNPAEDIQRPRIKESRRRALTDEEYDFFLKMCDKSQYGLWIKFHLLMGLRPEEVAGIRYEDIKDGYVNIRISKTNKGKRLVPVPNAIEIPNGSGYIFKTSAGYPLSKQATQRWWRYFKRECDIELGAIVYRNKIIESRFPEGVSLYTMRHTFATRMASKLPINVLADILGHESINITRKYYLHENRENLELARDAMNL